ncbi:hypothetical protein PUNSTDRAFT_101732 [Punctularia strigosozonata HHB-11173 SS5]|uniref:uncharacterized protein n=1 Tax=Punctularia strigosozonata (strain HHB-11173) TaxID=741275 RepID=UPI0004416AD7|nr:uncharacterized protein PUNSTDRAFT_101732 [Punctularia strigosozonata HHB-11173 SS5]EIN09809.1 hypothetical protein PUNSTDRAFT_101732 [Punctularia strigosozonata HHB-11173 SS5]
MKHEHADVAAMRDRCRLLERAVRETREMLRARDGEIERLKREMARLVEEHQREREEDRRALQQVNAASLKMQAEREQGTLRPKRSFHVAARNGREVATAVPRKAWSEAEARARQKSLEVFCTKTDEWSGADVCEAVRDLNSEVLQFAAGVSELCATTTTRGGARNSPAKPAVQAIQDTAARLGPGFVRVLASRDHGRDPILVQFALQSLLSACVARFFASFCPGLASKYDMLLCQIYEHMRATRAQATSARWRALTHHHIRALYRTVEEHALNELAATMLRWTADLLAAAGCREAQAAFAAPVALKTRFGPQLRRIVLAVGKLAQVTREEILSTNFEVGTVPQGTAYDATEMCDAAEDGEAAAAQAAAAGRAKVLCCTELGLRCTTRKEDAGEEEDEEGTMDETLLLKPKVVLESIVAALDR